MHVWEARVGASMCQMGECTNHFPLSFFLNQSGNILYLHESFCTITRFAFTP